jgi:hypothetical protein
MSIPARPVLPDSKRAVDALIDIVCKNESGKMICKNESGKMWCDKIFTLPLI